MPAYKPHYVTMIDTFMSGWGPSEGRDNMLIIVCNNRAEADTVAGNAHARGDQKRIHISTSEPAFFSRKAYQNPDKYTDEHGAYVSQGYYCQIKTREDMPRWFEEGAFSHD